MELNDGKLEIRKEIIDTKNFKNETCSYCGSHMIVPNGSCVICLECGTTNGCS